MEWITANWVEIGVVAGAVIFAAQTIAKLTPTKTDDKWVAAVYKIAAIIGVKVPDNPGKQ